MNERRARGEYTRQEALTILISACRVGQQEGAFTLQDARKIANAIDVLEKKPKED